MKCPACKAENLPGTRFCGSCGAPFQPEEEKPLSPTKTLQFPAEELNRGTVFAGRFEVIEKLGKGGMATVYRVVDKRVEEEVALKLLNPEIAADEKTIARFRNELKFARKIAHKNVCRMYDLNEEEGTQYITMEYVPGEDLKSTIIRVGQLSTGKAIFIAKQVCEGLAEAHRLGVVHRDLKPQNIMVDREGNTRIMDFGIARSAKARGITDVGMIIGTPEYMSPEQVDGKEADRRSDIYSLGVILYEMVTGHIPFEGDTPLSVALKQKTEEPQEPVELNAHIPGELNRLILKCMEKNKEKRYQTAEELLSELAKVEKRIPTTERVVPRRRPLTSKEITVKFSLRKLFVPVAALIVLIIAALALWKLFSRKEVALFPPGKPSLAVMYFENNTGDPSLDHWRKGLSDLLISDLSQSKYISVLSGEELFRILDDLNLLDARSYSSRDVREVSSRAGVRYVLVGKLHMAGDMIRLNTMLQDAGTGNLIGSERVEGVGEESFFSMVDELTKRIKANFELSEREIADDIDREAGTITTGSPEAYRYYSEGVRFQNRGEYLKSIPLMEMAAAVDPEFAMAYRSLAQAYMSLGYGAEARKNLEKAFALKDRVSERERYYIEGDFYSQAEKTLEQSIRAYNKLLDLYPDDLIGNNALGLIYLRLEQWDKAREHFEACLRNKIESVFPYWNLAVAYGANGKYAKAKEILESYLNNFPDHALVHFYLATNFIFENRLDLASQEEQKAFSLDPTHSLNFLMRGDLFMFKGGFSGAEKEYQKALQTEEPAVHNEGQRRLAALSLLQGKFEKAEDHAGQGIELAEMLGETEWESWFHLYSAYLLFKSKRFKDALAECEKVLNSALEGENLYWQRRALHLQGLIFLGMKSAEQAQKIAVELEELAKKGMNEKEMRYHDHLMGMIELQRGDVTKAVEYLQKAVSLMPSQCSLQDDHALLIYPLATAYFQKKDLEGAQKEYERIISLTTGRMYYGDIYALSFYELGRIYQEKGMKEKAAEHYREFLEIWKEADPGREEIKDANNRLSAIQ